jgi:predicted  nucleic acid-binding Zn-ribbon protein
VLRLVPNEPGKETMRLDAKEFLAVTILLQADPVLKGSGELKEAGQGFWLALDLASEGKYAQAKNLLQLAIAKHKTNRAANPNKRLNPTTDPNEQIFEIACLQLMEYWDLKAKGPGKTPPSSDPKEFAALKLQYETLQKKKEEADLALTKATQAYEKLADDSKTFEKTKKALEDDLKAAKKDLDAKTGEIAKLNDVVKDREKKLTEYGDAAKTVDAAVEAKKKAEAELTAAKKEVDAKATEIAKLNATVKDLDKKLASAGEPNKALDDALEAKKKAELALKTSQ